MMKCTRRSINSHISEDPYFKSNYLSLVGFGLLHNSYYGSKSLFCNPFGDSMPFRYTYSLDIKTRFLCSCSGLLLLFMDYLCVANPLTKRYRFLDHSKSIFLGRVKKRGELSFNLRSHKMNRIGFAVDQIDRTSQGFKVVCMKDTTSSNPDQTMCINSRLPQEIPVGNCRKQLLLAAQVFPWLIRNRFTLTDVFTG